VFFVPFVVNQMYGNHFLTPLWSVGVEEIYYLAWAPVAKLLRKKLVLIMCGTVLVKIVLSVWAHYYSRSVLMQDVLRMLQFEAMAAGGLGAYFVFHYNRPMHTLWLFARPVQVVLMLPLLARLFTHQSLAASSSLYAAIFDHAVFSPLLLMAIFTWFIINLAVNERTILRLDWGALNYLGDISYGIYMYHALAISLVFVPFLKEFRAAPDWPATIFLHLLVGSLTVLMAAASKKFFEARFLSYKDRFKAVDRAHPFAARELAVGRG
jgi:peptidoglycan/LPS O-acetylase OafA/YrhL